MTHIIDEIENWTLKTPEKKCYESIDSAYTYAELSSKSDALAVQLRENFVTNAPIVVYGGMEFEMLVCFLACIKSGHAYIPLDKHTPEERTRLITDVANPAAVLAVGSWEIEQTIPVIANSQLQEWMSAPVNPPQKEWRVTEDENFYIIFTSGTTGVPKGVQISHNNLLSFTSWMNTEFSLPLGSRILSQAPYSFDLSVMSIYPALTTGGTLCTLEKDIINDFSKLFKVLPQIALDVWVSTPSFMDICLMDPNFRQEKLPSLSHFLFCGEELLHVTAEKLREHFPKASVWNTYGPTEATVAFTSILIDDQLLSETTRLPIGRVKTDSEVLIMDTDGNLLANDEIGEIVLVGPSVSKGYYQSKEKTKAAFFLYHDKQAYRTGDAGVLRNDILYYKGRIDFQIKFHGYRMELEDIDHHLSEVSFVQACAVVPKYENHKVKQLVAFVVAKENDFAKEFQLAKAIKAELAESVMDYMIPQKYVFVESLPITQNGKVDRKRLIHEVNPT